MKRLFVIFALSFFLSVCVEAQKKEIQQAQSYIKSGKNLDKAEADMRKLLNDSSNIGNLKIWHTLTEAIRMQYEQSNEQLYLKQKSDTASLFKTVRRLFIACQAMDSIDCKPNKKGKVDLKYRKRHAEYLNGYRKNLYNGGVYFIGKQKFLDAFSMFDSYLDCCRQPLFSDYKYDENSRMSLSAAYLATTCGVKAGNDSLALKYSQKALLYDEGREKTLQYLVNIYAAKNDKESYLKYLRIGLDDYPKSEYFFTRIVDFYNNNNQSDSALNVVDKAIAMDSVNTLYLYAKSNIMLNIGKYKDCILLCDKLLAINDSVADAYYNAGVAYLNLAFETEKKSENKNKALVKKYYKCALPYMEKYRSLAPNQKDRWATALYNIYLNLNMGKKFEEITNLLQN